MIRVMLPAHLRTLAHVDGEVSVEVGEADAALRARRAGGAYPVLRGTIRDHVTHERRPFVRFFACEEDLSHEPADRVALRGCRGQRTVLPLSEHVWRLIFPAQ